jgi:hypothetical protein
MKSLTLVIELNLQPLPSPEMKGYSRKFQTSNHPQWSPHPEAIYRPQAQVTSLACKRPPEIPQGLLQVCARNWGQRPNNLCLVRHYDTIYSILERQNYRGKTPGHWLPEVWVEEGADPKGR